MTFAVLLLGGRSEIKSKTIATTSAETAAEVDNPLYVQSREKGKNKLKDSDKKIIT